MSFRICFYISVQIRHSQLSGDRPACLMDPTHPINRHGHYMRHGDCDSLVPLERILRFLCLPCGRTISVLPDRMLPYRPISASLVEANFDAKANDQPEPPITEKENGCLKRAWKRFGRRLDAHASALGQLVQTRNLAAKPVWLQLRRLGSLPEILLLLSRSFNTSLLLDYQCLRPWSRASG